MQAAATGGLAAALVGGPVSAISTAVLIEMGSLSIEVAKKMHAIKNYKNNHELAYIIETESKLNPKT
jgi:hypothetical protein